MIDRELKKQLESETRRKTAQHYRQQNSENNNDVCTNCVHIEFKLSNYSAAYGTCSIGGFIIQIK